MTRTGHLNAFMRLVAGPPARLAAGSRRTGLEMPGVVAGGAVETIPKDRRRVLDRATTLTLLSHGGSPPFRRVGCIIKLLPRSVNDMQGELVFAPLGCDQLASCGRKHGKDSHKSGWVEGVFAKMSA